MRDTWAPAHQGARLAAGAYGHRLRDGMEDSGGPSGEQSRPDLLDGRDMPPWEPCDEEAIGGV